jgi:hypothetical protein
MEPVTPSRLQSVKSCCGRLRWTGMYMDVEPDPRIPNMRDGLFWCSHSMTCLGPDGRVATEGNCCEGRGCFEPL